MCVYVCVCVHFTSRVSFRPENHIMYSTGDEGQNICVDSTCAPCLVPRPSGRSLGTRLTCSMYYTHSQCAEGLHFSAFHFAYDSLNSMVVVLCGHVHVEPLDILAIQQVLTQTFVEFTEDLQPLNLQ